MPELIPITPGQKLPAMVGHKTASILWLQKQQVITPESWALPWSAHAAWQHRRAIPPNWLNGLDPDHAYAVRSSANVEDGAGAAFAGQFGSVLNVRGRDQLEKAVQTVFSSAESDLVQSYLAQQNLTSEAVKMGILIQKMVPPQFSGVVFTKNPVTGLDEVVIEAVEGSGEKLVQDGVTPWRWVHKWGKMIAEPAEHPLSPTLLNQIVATASRLADRRGAPLDLEWVFDGRDIFWVQARPITTLEKLNFYSNRISKEVLPGLIKPLVWTTNIPLVNTAWIEIFTELIGPNDLAPHDLTRSIHYRAYFNMGTIGRVFTSLGLPEETLELIMGLEGGDQKPSFRPSLKVVRHLPRMVRFGWSKWRFAAAIERQLPRLEQFYLSKAAQPLPDTETGLLEDIAELYDRTIAMAYLNIVGPILAQIHTAVFHRRLKKIGIDPAQVEMRSGEEFDRFNPNASLSSLHELYRRLPAEGRETVDQGNIDKMRRTAPKKFIAAFDRFLTRFGHLSDSGNDFSYPPWRETPELVLQLISGFKPAAKQTGADKMILAELPQTSRAIQHAYRRTRQFQIYREHISSTYVFGYGLMRDRFLALGRAFTHRALLKRPDDIFFLTFDEVRERVRSGPGAPAAQELVAQRRADMDAARPAILPELVYGDGDPPLVTTKPTAHNQLQGIPTSRGYYQGPARIVRQVSDFGRLQIGDVLVIPFSDVSWTPLFAKAGAVVAESGGMLSHSSIVAREYGLPAVVSVDGATHRLQDGQPVAVDGFAGSVTVLLQDNRFDPHSPTPFPGEGG